VELDDPLVLALAKATESRRIQYLQQVLRNTEAAQEVALRQRKALLDDKTKNASLLDKNRDARKKDVHAQFQTPIDELERQIAALKKQRDGICANLDATTQQEHEKMNKEHAEDMASVDKYLQGTEAFRDACRDKLAMVRQLAANAPDALVVSNLVGAFSGARGVPPRAARPSRGGAGCGERAGIRRGRGVQEGLRHTGGGGPARHGRERACVRAARSTLAAWMRAAG
jgi:hypothetical protein